MDAIDLLTQQHRQLEQCMRAWVEGEATARAALFARVGDELTVHMASEEQVFYPAVKARRTEDILLESLEEHLSLKRLLADLVAMDPADPGFEPKFKVLREQAEHHHEEEEEHLFPKVRQLLGAAQLQELGTRMARLQAQLRRGGDPREAIGEQTDRAAPLA